MSEAEMVEVKTADLIGPALDWAVAKADGFEVFLKRGYPCYRRHLLDDDMVFSPSTDWARGGPLIDKHMLSVKPHGSTNGVITSWSASMTWPCDTMPGRCGKTPLVAVCRAIVTKELGETMKVPKELMQ